MPSDPSQGLELRAGRLHVWLDTQAGALRSIHADGYEVLRGIHAPVRDEVWGTVAPRVTGLNVEQAAGSFTATFVIECRREEIHFIWRASVRGTAESELHFELAGEALGSFRSKRIGICVLHPAEAKGRPCTVEHRDGRAESAHFPETILPTPPFTDFCAIRHEVVEGLHAEVRMNGGAFEMEDQRNWTDASFKSYSPPLSAATLLALEPGSRIRQSITLRVSGRAGARTDATPRGPTPREVLLKVGAPLSLRAPLLGIGWTDTEAPAAVVKTLRTLTPAHLRVDLWEGDPERHARLAAAAKAAHALSAALELALFAESEVRLGALVKETRSRLDSVARETRVARWIVHHESQPVAPLTFVARVRKELAGCIWEAPVGAGSCDNFAELNRAPEAATAGDFAVFACNPQVHAFDDLSIMETLMGQREAVISARLLAHGRPVAVSPITFHRRWRVGEAGVPGVRPTNLLPFRPDTRLDTPFARAWLFGSIVMLTKAGATSATYLEVREDNGVLTETGALRSVSVGMAVGSRLRGKRLREVDSSHPSLVDSVGWEQDGRIVVAMANLSAATLQVRVEFGRSDWRIALDPYEVRELDLVQSVHRMP